MIVVTKMLGMGGIVSASERGSGLTAELPDDCSRKSEFLPGPRRLLWKVLSMVV